MSFKLRLNIELNAKVVLLGYDIKIAGYDFYEITRFVTNFDDWKFCYLHNNTAWFELKEEGAERKIIGIPSEWIEEGFDENRLPLE